MVGLRSWLDFLLGLYFRLTVTYTPPIRVIYSRCDVVGALEGRGGGVPTYLQFKLRTQSKSGSLFDPKCFHRTHQLLVPLIFMREMYVYMRVYIYVRVIICHTTKHGYQFMQIDSCIQNVHPIPPPKGCAAEGTPPKAGCESQTPQGS